MSNHHLTYSVHRNLPCRTWMTATALLFSIVLFSAHATAVEYPTRPITLVLPATAGGSTDIAGRLIAEGLSKELGQPVVAENKAGAGGIVASSYVLDKPADGYTLLLAISSKTVMKALQEKPLYDALKDFRTVSLIAQVPTVLVAPASLGVKNFADLKNYVRDHPGQVMWAIPGIGTAPHLTGYVLTRAMGADVTEVQYRGSAPMHIDVIAGRVNVTTDSYISLQPHIDSGAVVPLAVIGHTRLQQLPNVPTLTELGYADFSETLFDGWNAIDVRAGTPEPIIQRLNEALGKFIADPAVKQRIESMGLVLFDPQTSGEAQKFVEETSAKLEPLARSLNQKGR
ncbi:tripartite tricarboxylate transporter substrate-binding protein [Pollutimonas bauzanensis]|uniref:Bug family tripartite tricarboxylate transporter substrate binding protein n=1 Tax=Pollutimonas bauzanensis TaxID=658167 RepID=UPI0033417F45